MQSPSQRRPTMTVPQAGLNNGFVLACLDSCAGSARLMGVELYRYFSDAPNKVIG